MLQAQKVYSHPNPATIAACPCLRCRLAREIIGSAETFNAESVVDALAGVGGFFGAEIVRHLPGADPAGEVFLRTCDEIAGRRIPV